MKKICSLILEWLLDKLLEFNRTLLAAQHNHNFALIFFEFAIYI